MQTGLPKCTSKSVILQHGRPPGGRDPSQAEPQELCWASAGCSSTQISNQEGLKGSGNELPDCSDPLLKTDAGREEGAAIQVRSPCPAPVQLHAGVVAEQSPCPGCGRTWQGPRRPAPAAMPLCAEDRDRHVSPGGRRCQQCPGEDARTLRRAACCEGQV